MGFEKENYKLSYRDMEVFLKATLRYPVAHELYGPGTQEG